jgi:hypothetical protein
MAGSPWASSMFQPMNHEYKEEPCTSHVSISRLPTRYTEHLAAMRGGMARLSVRVGDPLDGSADRLLESSYKSAKD